MEPSAGLEKLLRLLDRQPESLAAITDRRRKPSPSLAETPFTITGDDIVCLREFELPAFVRSLLYAEAEAHGLPLDRIHVAEDYFVPDGGEDAHIRWQGGPERTPQLPSRYVQLQLKTGDFQPAKAASEVLTKQGQVKTMVRAAMANEAHYVLLCTKSLSGKQAKTMASRILAAMNEAGLVVSEDRIHVWDADQLAAWTNRYPALVTRLKAWTKSATGPFRSWTQWADRHEHERSPFVADERVDDLRARLVGILRRPGGVLRVVGASGIGKSRLTLESLDAIADGFPMREFVLYANLTEVDVTAVMGAVQVLADTNARAIVVADNCPSDTRRRLEGIAGSSRSRLSLLTIDDDVDRRSRGDPSIVYVDRAPSAVVEAVLDRILPGLGAEDKRRLMLFSKVIPRLR